MLFCHARQFLLNGVKRDLAFDLVKFVENLNAVGELYHHENKGEKKKRNGQPNKNAPEKRRLLALELFFYFCSGHKLLILTALVGPALIVGGLHF